PARPLVRAVRPGAAAHARGGSLAPGAGRTGAQPGVDVPLHRRAARALGGARRNHHPGGDAVENARTVVRGPAPADAGHLRRLNPRPPASRRLPFPARWRRLRAASRPTPQSWRDDVRRLLTASTLFLVAVACSSTGDDASSAVPAAYRGFWNRPHGTLPIPLPFHPHPAPPP